MALLCLGGKMLENKVKETIAKYNLIQKGDKIVVGVSGGPDSMTLLTVLLKLKNAYDLEIHLHHPFFYL